MEEICLMCCDNDSGVCVSVLQGGMLVCELCDSVYHPECAGQSAPRGIIYLYDVSFTCHQCTCN